MYALLKCMDCLLNVSMIESTDGCRRRAMMRQLIGIEDDGAGEFLRLFSVQWRPLVGSDGFHVLARLRLMGGKAGDVDCCLLPSRNAMSRLLEPASDSDE